MKRLVAASLLVVSSLFAAPAVAGAADSGSAIELPLWNLSELLVDDTNDQIYFVPWGVSNSIYVTDLDGQPVGSIDGLFDPRAVALSPDATTLYITQPWRDNIVLVDTSTLQIIGTIDVPEGYCPGSIALSGQYVVVAFECDFDPPGHVGPGLGAGVLDTLGGGNWVPFHDQDANSQVSSAQGTPGIIVMSNPHDVTSYDLSTSPPTVLGYNSDYRSIEDAVMMPDGSEIIVGTNEDNTVRLLMPGLEFVRTYATERGQDAIAVTPDGAYVAIGTDDVGIEGTTLHPFDKRQPVRGYPLPQPLLRRALGVDAAAERLYAVTLSDGPFLSLHVLPGLGWPECDGHSPTILGTAGPDTITGTAGTDIILGLGGDDVIDGLDGHDVICAGGGDDLLIGGDGDDTLFGGTGIDTVSYANAPAAMNVNLELQTATGDGTDTVKAENVIGSPFDDVLKGSSGANRIEGGLGNDIIKGKAGSDELFGGAGDDDIEGNGGRDEIIAGSGSDVVAGHKGDDVIEGGDGSDWIVGNGGDDIIDGGAEGDTIEGGSGSDNLSGGDGSDLMLGGSGRDFLEGGIDDDLLIGGGSDDTLFGDDGNDTLAGEGGDDFLDGGLGVDTASFAVSSAGVDASIPAGAASGEGDDTLISIEWLVGSNHGDTLTGDDGENLLDARGGDDSLVGDQGDDFLQGGAGYDILKAGKGDDLCAEGEELFSCDLVMGFDLLPTSTYWYSSYLARGAQLFGIALYDAL